MIRYIVSAILIGISITLFFSFADPLYKEISELKDKVASYNQALDNSKALLKERDELTAKYNAISQENLEKIEKFLPDNVDNIRLILEIEKIALPYGMALKDVKYNVVKKEVATTEAGGFQGDVALNPGANPDYGSWDLEFATTGSYSNFINFTKDLESNLRMVDISSVTFSSGASTKDSLSEVYPFSFKIKTYWLKN